jgi:hypothetical protein
MREFRLNQKTAILAIERLRGRGRDPFEHDYIPVFEKEEQTVLSLPSAAIDLEFSDALKRLGEERIDELLYSLAVATDEHRFSQRMISLQAALAASQVQDKDRGILRRIFGL